MDPTSEIIFWRIPVWFSWIFAKLSFQPLLLRGAEASSLELFLPGCGLNFISHLRGLQQESSGHPTHGKVYQEESPGLTGGCRFSRTHSQVTNFKWINRCSLWRFTTLQKLLLTGFTQGFKYNLEKVIRHPSVLMLWQSKWQQMLILITDNSICFCKREQPFQSLINDLNHFYFFNCIFF